MKLHNKRQFTEYPSLGSIIPVSLLTYAIGWIWSPMTISPTGSYLSRRFFQDISFTVANNFTLVFIFVLSLLETASGFKSTFGIPARVEVGTRSACERCHRNKFQC